MQVNAAGQFTGKWLFDAVILTTQDVDSQDIMYAALTGTNLSDLLTQEFADAAALNSAAAALAASLRRAAQADPGRDHAAVAEPGRCQRDAARHQHRGKPVGRRAADERGHLVPAAGQVDGAGRELDPAVPVRDLLPAGGRRRRRRRPGLHRLDEHRSAFPGPFHHLGALLRRPGRVRRRQPRFHRHRHPARILFPRRPVRRGRERFPAVQHRLESRRAAAGVGIRAVQPG